MDGSPIELWNRLFGRPGGEAYLNVFSGARPPNSAEKRGEANKNDLEDVRDLYFRWPEEAARAAEWAMKESEAGREVYQCAHLLSERKRRKETAVSPVAFFADGDGARIPEWMPPPNVVLESSPGRHQYGWRLSEEMPKENFEEMNRRLTYAIGADKTKWSLTALLRIPGTKNRKYDEVYDEPPLVRIEELNNGVYDPEEFERVLSPENLRRVLSGGVYKTLFGGEPNGHERDAARTSEPPILLDGYGTKVWRGEITRRTDHGEVDRSASLLLIGRVLYDAGATKETIVRSLKERDVALGWMKYAPRGDDKEYVEIFKELESKGRNERDAHASVGGQYGHHGGASALGRRVLLGEASKKGIDPPEELVEDVLLRGGVHQLYSQGGIGKTFVALYVSGVLVDRGEAVLYLDRENGSRVVVERLVEGFGADSDKLDELLYYHPEPELNMSLEAHEAFLRTIGEVNPALVIFDSLIDFLAYAGLEDNSPTDVAKWFVKYVHPLRKRGIAVLILDHTNKTDESDSRGAGQKKNEVDVQWYLRRKKEFDRNTVGELTLHKKKDRQSWLPEMVRFKVGGSDDGFVFEKVGTKGKVDDGLSHDQRVVLNVLKDEFGAKGASYTEWKSASEKKGVKEDSFKKCRTKLLGDNEQKRFVRKEKREYFPAEG